jgi:hypothetical protein
MKYPILDSRLTMVAALCLTLISILVGPSQAGEQISLPTAGLRDATLADLKPHASGSKTYNEFWTYHLFLDGNIQVSLNFSRVNLGSFKSPVCGADLTVLGFKGRNYSVAREYEKKNFVFTDSNSQLRVHEKIWFEGNLPQAHHVHFATSKKDVSYLMDLQFTEIEQGKVWGDGMFKFGSSNGVGIFIHIPRAKFTGTLAINADTLKVSGLAYMDHTFQTDMAPGLVESGYRYISQSGTLEVGYLLNPNSNFESKPIGYGLRQTPTGIVLLKPVHIKAISASNAMGVKVPTALEIDYMENGKSLLQRSADRLQQSTLHEFSGFTKMAIKRYMGGEVLTFRGIGTLNGSQPMGYSFFAVD